MRTPNCPKSPYFPKCPNFPPQEYKVGFIGGNKKRRKKLFDQPYTWFDYAMQIALPFLKVLDAF